MRRNFVPPLQRGIGETPKIRRFKIQDEERQSLLEEMGLRFLRFHDEEVRKDIGVVTRAIEEYIDQFCENL